MNMNRYHDALLFAAQLHAGQTRKGNELPYLTHLMAVSGLVFEYGGDEDQAIAGLLHDSIEDQSEDYGGVDALSAEIKRRFGADVLAMVLACTDAVTFPKPPWRERKEAYLGHLRLLDPRSALVSAADKLHNLRTILADFRWEGDAVFDRFTADKAGTLWYHESLATIYLDCFPNELADEVWRTAEALLDEAGALPEGRNRVVLYRKAGHTVEWAYYETTNRGIELVVEAYDYGEHAESFNGGDIALMVRLDKADQAKLVTAIAEGSPALPLAGPTPLARLRRLRQRFGRYHDFEAFVSARKISAKALADWMS